MPAADQSSIGAARQPRSLLSLASCFGVCVIFAVHFFSIYHYQSQPHGDRLHDFPTFYAAAKLALSHGDIYTAGATPDVRYVYPPLIAFVFTPLTMFSLVGAAHVFALLNTLMISGSIWLATKTILSRLNLSPTRLLWPCVFLCSLLSWTQTHNLLIMGETDALMLFLFTLAFYWLDSNPLLAGMALGFAFNIKYLPVVAIPYFLLRRRWAAALFTLLGSIFFAWLPALLLGWRETARDLRVSMGGLLRWVGVAPERSHSIRLHDIADDLSVSLTSALARVLQPHGFSNFAVLILAGAIGLIVLLLAAWVYHRNGVSLIAWPDSPHQSLHPFRQLVALEWPGLVTAALVFSPDTNTRHLVMGVLVNALGAVLLLSLPPRRSRKTLLGLLIIFVTYTMPFGRAASAMHLFYYRYSLPGCGLLAGYLLILWTGLELLSSPLSVKPRAATSPRSRATGNRAPFSDCLARQAEKRYLAAPKYPLNFALPTV